MAYTGYSARLSRKGRLFTKGTIHKIVRIERNISDDSGGGYTVNRLHVSTGGYFDDYDFSDLKVGDTFVENQQFSGSRYERTDFTDVTVVDVGADGTVMSVSSGASKMVGQVYSAAVVRTKTVAAGEGVNTGVQVSEVVSTKTGYIASSDEVARAIALAEAIVDSKGTLNPNDPTQPVEVRLSKFA